MNGHRVGAAQPGRLYASTTDTYDEAADLDYIAIEYVLNGEPVDLTPAEKIFAARILDDRGYNTQTIAGRVGSDSTTVSGWRDNGWKPGRPPRQKRPDPVCGEPRMYRRHLKNGERCDVCRAANAAADRRYRLTGTWRPAA